MISTTHKPALILPFLIICVSFALSSWLSAEAKGPYTQGISEDRAESIPGKKMPLKNVHKGRSTGRISGQTGGWRAYLVANTRYPKKALNHGTQGTVKIMMMVRPDGQYRLTLK